MSKLNKISHPLVRDGRSQNERFITALSPDYARVDERSQEDILSFLNQYAQQVLLHKNDGTVGNWESFFEFNTPIQIALISKFNTEVLRNDYKSIINQLIQSQSTILVAPSFSRILEAAEKINSWYLSLRDDFSLKIKIKNAVEINLQHQLKNLVKLHNGVRAKYSTYRETLNTQQFLRNETLWKLNVLDLTQIDNEFLSINGSDAIKFNELKKRLDTIFENFINVIQQIVGDAPEFYQKSLKGFDSNTPHLGLLLAFLRLFELLQGDLNGLTRRHLDFFYRDILRLKEKPIVPDQAHLIFETAPQIADFKIDKGRLFTAGKDDSGAEIRYSLDEEVILNHAQIESLQTLFLEPCPFMEERCYDPLNKISQTEEELALVNQVYIAPIANSMDGVGEAFEKEVRPSWETLGSKLSRFERVNGFQNHPEAVLGMVVASSSLLLEGGQREITITFQLESLSINEKSIYDLKEIIEEDYFTINETSIKVIKENGYPPEVIAYVESYLWKVLNEVDVQSFINNRPLDSETIPDYAFNESLLKEPTQEEPDRLGVLQSTKIFRIECSIEDGWLPIKIVDKITLQNDQLSFDFTLNPEAPPLTGTHPDIHSQLGTSFLPAVKILLQKNEIPFPKEEKLQCGSLYHFLRQIKIKETSIDIAVSKFKNVVLQNEAGVLDINKSFQPFGVIPKIGSKFYIGSQELFQKDLTKLDFEITWDGLPKNGEGNLIGFKNHYKAYRKFTDLPDSSKFKINVGILKNNEWSHSSTQSLFNFPLTEKNEIALGIFSPQEINEEITQYTVNSKNGFICFELTPQDFLHSEYGPALTRQMLAIGSMANGGHNALGVTNAVLDFGSVGILPPYHYSSLKENISDLKGQAEGTFNQMKIAETDANKVKSSAIQTFNQANKTSNNITTSNVNLTKTKAEDTRDKAITAEASADVAKNNTLKTRNDARSLNNVFVGLEKKIPIPNQPYTPTIKEFNICYKAKADKKDVQLIHLFPYEGTYKKKNFDTQLTFLPDFQYEGNLFIGLKNLIPGSMVNLLFQMVESTANPDLDKGEVKWSYLKDNEWKPLYMDFEILSDDTKGLIQSGIVQIAVPADINKKNTILSNDLHWLRVATPSNSAAIAETLMIHTQAAKVTFQNNENDLARLSNPLPAGTLAAPLENLAAVASVNQFYDSFGGQALEPTSTFDNRVSEHLRHKGRAITLYDYERIVLEAFSDVFKVKCITHTLGRKMEINDYEIAPGFITITVVPDVSKLTYAGKLRPKATLATLQKIEDFLRSKVSPFIRLKVLNPRYETFNVEFKVKFHSGKSEDFYKAFLKNSIQEFLAPWAFGEQERLSFGGVIYSSSILNFIEQQEYVDYVTDFTLIVKQKNNEDVLVDIHTLEVKGRTARSILVLEKLPEITVIDKCDSFTGTKSKKIMTIGSTS